MSWRKTEEKNAIIDQVARAHQIDNFPLRFFIFFSPPHEDNSPKGVREVRPLYRAFPSVLLSLCLVALLCKGVPIEGLEKKSVTLRRFASMLSNCSRFFELLGD